MNTPRIVVVAAGVSDPSSTALLGHRLAESTVRQLAAQNVAAETVEIGLRDLSRTISDYLTMGFPGGDLSRALDEVRSADALIAVSPTFKAAYSGLFKSFWDVTTDGDVAGTPTLLAGTGGSARHSLMIESSMRPLFSYLHADVVSTGVFAATDDFADSGLQSRIDRAAGQLAERILWRGGFSTAVAETPAGAADVVGVAEDDGGDASGAGFSSSSFAAEDVDPGTPAAEGPVPGVEEARTVDSELNAGQDERFRAKGLPALEITPFDQLLGK